MSLARPGATVLLLTVLIAMTACEGDKLDPGASSETPQADAAGGAGGVVAYVPDIEQFFLDHCLACHSATPLSGSRRGAPGSLNFDTYEDAVRWSDRASRRIRGGTMPPGGGVPTEDRDLFAAWLAGGLLETSP